MERKFKFYYELNEDGRKDAILKGLSGNSSMFKELELNEEILKMSCCNVASNGECTIRANDVFEKYDIEKYDFKITTYKIKESYYSKYFSKVLTDSEIYAMLHESCVKFNEGVPQHLVEEFNKLKKEEEINEDEYQKEKELRKKEEEAAQEAMRLKDIERNKKDNEYIKERKKWINDFGSSKLKKYLEAAIDCNELYLKERAAIDFKGLDATIYLNSDSDMDYMEIERMNDPSEYILDILLDLRKKGYSTDLFTIESVDSSEYDFDFKEEDAVIMIDEYLHYDNKLFLVFN